MTKVTNYLIVAVLFCFMIVVSQVECGAQQCASSKVGSKILGVVPIENDETLENSLMTSNKKLTRRKLHGKRRNKSRKNKHTYSRKTVSHVSVNRSSSKTKGKSVKLHNVIVPNKRHHNKNKSNTHSAQTLVTNTRIVGISVNRVTAQQIIEQSLPTFDGSLGPTQEYHQNRRPVNNNRRLTPQTEAPDQVGGPRCVACRVDCLKEYSRAGGAVFSACSQRYYYYGCQTVKPCEQPFSTSDAEIEGMVGICALRNGCQYKSVWQGASSNRVITNRLIAAIRTSGQTPE